MINEIKTSEKIKKLAESLSMQIIHNETGSYEPVYRKTLAAIEELNREIVSQHNAKILNAFQLQGKPDMPFIAYDERVCLVPAIEVATKETLDYDEPTA